MVSEMEIAFNMTLEPKIYALYPKELLCYRTRSQFHFPSPAMGLGDSDNLINKVLIYLGSIP